MNHDTYRAMVQHKTDRFRAEAETRRLAAVSKRRNENTWDAERGLIAGSVPDRRWFGLRSRQA